MQERLITSDMFLDDSGVSSNKTSIASNENLEPPQQHKTVNTHRRVQSDHQASKVTPANAPAQQQRSLTGSLTWTRVLGINQESNSKSKSKIDFELRERLNRQRTSSTVNSSSSQHSGASTVHASSSVHRRKEERKVQSSKPHTYTFVNTPNMNDLRKGHGLITDWDDLVNIDIHRKHGLITDVQYRDSRAAMGGTIPAPNAKPRKSLSKKKIKDKEVLFQGMKFIKEQPDWSKVEVQNALKYVYNPSHEKWETSTQKIQISPHPFAYGSQRMCFYLRDVATDPENECKYVAKLISPIIEEREAYFKDVAMQTHAQEFADLFNQCGVVKKVAFLDCWVIEFIDQPVLEHYEPPGPQLLAVEPLLEGEYRKYNNNMDWIESTLARNTPQAFSHFSYEASGEEILICDVQGVNDIYTDPQFHTRLGLDDMRFGSGNLGKIGIDGFFNKHECNSICQYLKLKRRNTRQLNILDGTKTNTRFMQKDSVAYSGSVHGGSHMKSLPRPGGKVTYDATMSSLPPLLPGFKERKNRESPGKRLLCCCVVL